MKPRQKRIASISPSKRASRAAYAREAKAVVGMARAAFLQCPVCDEMLYEYRPVDCVHHLRGKGSEALRHDKRGWLLVSLAGHAWIDRNRVMARVRGWLCPAGKWGTPFKPDEPAMPGSVADLEAKGIL